MSGVSRASSSAHPFRHPNYCWLYVTVPRPAWLSLDVQPASINQYFFLAATCGVLLTTMMMTTPSAIDFFSLYNNSNIAPNYSLRILTRRPLSSGCQLIMSSLRKVGRQALTDFFSTLVPQRAHWYSIILPIGEGGSKDRIAAAFSPSSKIASIHEEMLREILLHSGLLQFR